MGIFSRLGDIVNANMNSLLDRAENPEKMIRNIIQEMEDTLVEVRSTAAKIIAEKKQLQRHITLAQSKQADWQEKAQLALSKGREDLAKGALLEKQQAKQIETELTQQSHFIDEDLVKLDHDIDELQQKLTDARSRQQQLLRRQQQASSQLKIRQHTSSERLDKVLRQMDSMARKIDHLEGHVEAHDLGEKKKSLADELNELEANDQINAELEKLKQQQRRDA